MEFKELWWPMKLGLSLRKKILKFSSSYGCRFMWIRRPIAVFFNALLDVNHQEQIEGTAHEKFKNQ